MRQARAYSTHGTKGKCSQKFWLEGKRPKNDGRVTGHKQDGTVWTGLI
jgi:hypothetical protein